jgi:hypothetical protein
MDEERVVTVDLPRLRKSEAVYGLSRMRVCRLTVRFFLLFQLCQHAEPQERGAFCTQRVSNHHPNMLKMLQGQNWNCARDVHGVEPDRRADRMSWLASLSLMFRPENAAHA